MNAPEALVQEWAADFRVVRLKPGEPNKVAETSEVVAFGADEAAALRALDSKVRGIVGERATERCLVLRISPEVLPVGYDHGGSKFLAWVICYAADNFRVFGECGLYEGELVEAAR